MALIYETNNFIVESYEPNPHITRTDGGHIKISPKLKVVDRQALTPKLSIELEWITSLIGESMKIGLNNNGIDLERINYQDNGNWSVFKPEGPYTHSLIWESKECNLATIRTSLHISTHQRESRFLFKK